MTNLPIKIVCKERVELNSGDKALCKNGPVLLRNGKEMRDSIMFGEYNCFSDDEFQAGIDASLEYWADAYGSSISQEDADAYKNAVGSATEEKVAVQKYIDLWLNGTEAWTEIRRTGYPEQVLRPGEKTAELNGNAITFEPLSDVKNDIIARVKYPTNESTLNGANWKEAVAKLDDGTNNYYTKMFWDVRTSTYDHPANK